jgi:hypothetical protein
MCHFKIIVASVWYELAKIEPNVCINMSDPETTNVITDHSVI